MTPRFPRRDGTHAHTIFLQFDGADVSPGDIGDARNGASELVRKRSHVPALDWNAFGGDAGRVEITAAVVALFANYDLRIVAERPQDTDEYVMIVIGGQSGDIDAPASARGYAPLDCEDDNAHDIVFVFAEALALDFAGDPRAARMSVATVAAQESAHAFGLVHTDNANDVMYPYVEYPTGAQHFAEGAVLGLSCGRPPFQDSAELLMEVLGPRRN